MGAVALTLFGLAGCATPSPSPAPEAPVSPTRGQVPESAVPRGARYFEVDAGRTQVVLLVRRGGALSKLGHNHVIRSDAESGHLWIAADGRSSGLELHVPVSSLVVDDPAARAGAGADFAASVPEDARAGTFGNMTGERVLDAANHPEIVVSYAGAVPLPQSAPVRVKVQIKGQERVLDVPMVVTTGEHEIAAAGETRVLQSELGIEPFSILGGAIAVADEITVRFELVATLTQPQN